jgi:hypothetical protein
VTPDELTVHPQRAAQEVDPIEGHPERLALPQVRVYPDLTPTSPRARIGPRGGDAASWRGVASPDVATSWKCRLGLHKYARRHHGHGSDPSHQVCVRCRKERIAGEVGGLLSRWGG